MQEEITVTQKDDGNYLIVRKIREDITSEELIKIYDEIEKAESDLTQQISDIPKQIDERTKGLSAQSKLLQLRKNAFSKYALNLKSKLPELTK